MRTSRRALRKNKGSISKRRRTRLRWTRAEVTILRRLYRTRSNAEIAGILGRRVSSIVFKAHRLGLSKGIRRLREMGRENINLRWKTKRKRRVKRAKSA